MATAEHRALVEVLRVGLTDADATLNADPPVVILRDMAQEWQRSDMGTSLSVEKLDLILMARLVEAPPLQYPLPPVPFLLSCFQRVSSPAVSDMLRNGSKSDADIRAFQDSVEEQLASMVWLSLSDELIIPQTPALQARGALQLLDALWAAVPHQDDLMGASTEPCGPVALPRGFLSRSLSCAPSSEFSSALHTVIFELGRRARGCSVLGDHNALAQAWTFLLEYKPLAKAVVSSRAFLPSPDAPHGRAFQRGSALAGFVGISFLVDTVEVEAKPSVRQQCLDTVDLQNPSQSQQVFESLQAASRSHLGALTALFSPKFLLSKDTRAPVLQWIAAALRCDQERTKMHPTDNQATSDGFACNLNRVLLHLCGPFMDFYSGKARQFIDLNYLANSGMFRYDDGEARLSASQSDFKEWVGTVAPSTTAGETPQQFHFITECFFMTAYALHLGVVKLLDKLKQLSQSTRMMERLARTGDPLARMRLQTSGIEATVVGIEFALRDVELQSQLIQWCQLVSAWLIFVATGSTPGQVTLPLPETPPVTFRVIPEHIISDMASLLMLAPVAPDDMHRMDDVILACTALMGSPSHVQNPYLRYTLCTVLHQWIPDERSSSRRRRRQQPDMEPLFTTHPGVSAHLVPALFELYKDVEYTDRGNQFYEKFSMRTTISELLEWLWTVPAHLDTWRAIARNKMWPGLYLRFLNNIVNDSIYLLDEAMKSLPEIKDKEALIKSPQWTGMSSRQQQDHMQVIEQMGSNVKFYLQTSDRFVSMLVATSADLPQPLLSAEMVGRIAQMLNYFLRHLVGPDRARLSVKNPEKYDFDAKKLLGSILAIFVHVFAADADRNFAVAIAEDTRSYRPENFSEASAIAADRALPGFNAHMLATLDDLAEAVEQATVLRVQEDDELIKEAPDEFVDPIMSTLMRDPVILPSSRQVIDRPNILRHLMTDPRDPINRAPLEATDLIPATELKQRIHAWIAERRGARRYA